MDRKSQKKDSKAALIVNQQFNAKNFSKVFKQLFIQQNVSAQFAVSKIRLIITSLAIFINLISFAKSASAQVTTVNGPSDAVSNPPASASAVSQVVASGSSISLKVGTASSSSDAIYQWYKLDNTGTKRLVQSSSSSALSETPSGAGYYTYQLVISNSNQCSSEISDPFKVYVLPPLAPTIAASNNTICSNGTSTSVLTANAGSDKYAYQYQWTLNGNTISGATASTYTTPANMANGDKAYAVRVAYTLNAATTGTANQTITVVPVPTRPSISVGQ